jgi:hypothetical protein
MAHHIASFSTPETDGHSKPPKLHSTREHLLEGVGAGAPVGEEQGETDSLEDAGNSADGDGVKRALLGDDLGDDLRRQLANVDNFGNNGYDVRKEQRKRRRSGSRGKQRPCR